MKDRLRRNVTGLLAVLSLAACLAAPILHWLGFITEASFKTAFLAASACWFAFRGSSGNKPAAN